jgi:hypothetical protein
MDILNSAARDSQEATMEETKERLLNQLVAVVRELPEDKLLEVYDFAGYLQSKYSNQQPERGSAEAILPHAGKLHFEPGELDQLLAEIEQMRLMDLEEHG